jgi:hypothetical protein
VFRRGILVEFDMKHLARGVLLGFAATMCAVSADASTIVLNFTGLQDHEYVNDFYNGGTGSEGSSGVNYGVSFVSFQACDAPGTFCTAVDSEPTPPTVGQISPDTTGIMNVSAGFDTGFALFYTDINAPTSAAIWSGLNGTGTLLATLDLPITLTGTPPALPYSVWMGTGITFAGTAESVVFAGGGGTDLISFDNITLGSDTPVGAPDGVPEPLTLSLFGAGLAGMAASRRRKSAR